MSIKVPIAIFTAMATFLLNVLPAHANQRWHWETGFSRDQRQDLTGWVELAHAGMERLFGHLPYHYDVYFFRANSSNKTIPWAHTRKGLDGRSVNFYVNTHNLDHSIDSNWTAYHELAHLMFPYLGKRGTWFAEGIASYLQYHIMYAAGELDWTEVIARYQDRFDAARSHDHFDDDAIIHLGQSGWQSGANIRLYWGGAAYFLEVDRRLHQEHGIRLHDVIRDYLDCCFGSRRGGVPGMIRHFNRISGTRVFSEVYEATVMRKGFPETQRQLAWLEQNPPSAVSLSSR